MPHSPTSPSALAPSPLAFGARARVRPGGFKLTGFTLTEVLVVIAVIALLLAIAIPAVLKASRQATATKIAADLQAIAAALEAYRQDHNDYPRLPGPGERVGTVANTPDRGSILLAWALFGPYEDVAVTVPPLKPGDGAKGLGFRIRATGQGKVFGPYIQPDRFRTRQALDYTNPAVPVTLASGHIEILDGYGQPIQYFAARQGRLDIKNAVPAAQVQIAPNLPSTKQVSVEPKPNYVGDNFTDPTFRAIFNLADAGVLEATPPPPGKITLVQRSLIFQYRVEQASEFRGPFVLWSAGPDQLFWNGDDVTSLSNGPQ